MRRVLACVTVCMFFVMMPFVSFAKEAISEGEMESVTAQEGVNIDFGAFVPATNTFGVAVSNFAPALQSWGDGDGFASYTSAGWIGSTMTIGALSRIGIGGVMTVDVGSSGAQTAVLVGLPRVIVHPVETDATFLLGTGKTLSDGQPALGTFYNDQFALVVNMNSAVGGTGGSMRISTHSGGGEGVDIAFGGTIGALAALPGWAGQTGLLLALPNTPIIQSWGDSDGFTGYGSAGYFGARNMTMAEGALGADYFWILLSGTMSIDVGTDTGGTTAVQIGLPTTRFYTSGITQTLVLSDAKQLTGTQVLGTSFMGGVQATITPATLTISAH